MRWATWKLVRAPGDMPGNRAPREPREGTVRARGTIHVSDSGHLVALVPQRDTTIETSAQIAPAFADGWHAWHDTHGGTASGGTYSRHLLMYRHPHSYSKPVPGLTHHRGMLSFGTTPPAYWHHGARDSIEPSAGIAATTVVPEHLTRQSTAPTRSRLLGTVTSLPGTGASVSVAPRRSPRGHRHLTPVPIIETSARITSTKHYGRAPATWLRLAPSGTWMFPGRAPGTLVGTQVFADGTQQFTKAPGMVAAPPDLQTGPLNPVPGQHQEVERYRHGSRWHPQG